MVTSSLAKPAATVTVEPTAARASALREHAITLKLELGNQRQLADKEHLLLVARRALDGFAPAAGESDRRRFGEVVATTTSRKTGPQTVVVAIEGSARCKGRPSDDVVTAVRDRVAREGYRVAVRETRACSAPECRVEAFVEWERADEVPRGWHSSTICGGHNYRTCARCKTIYALTSTNSVGPAPSVHCEVCGLVLVEWGSSKVWTAQLVTRGKLD